ncbi:MAG: DoxX family protein [Leptolyngbyaceae cyanobacterium SL_7_1]|nr:DoxX family protein [Leptolyngbyaceae cyanobacterium SL_7_1]
MNLTQRLSSLGSALFQSNLAPNYPSQIAWTVLRVVAGVVMIHNGLDKLSNIESFAEAYVSVIGLPFPIFFSYVAALTELIGAPLLIVGLFTRPAAFGLFSTMLVAMYHHIKVAGFSIPYLELSALYAACFFFYTVNGAGLFSLDSLIGGWLNAVLPGQDQREALEASYQKAEVASK